MTDAVAADAARLSLRAPVIAIDGPSGTGKGTIAEGLAQALGWHVLDSGALYRCLGLAAERAGLDLDDGVAMGELARRIEIRFDADRVVLDGDDVSDAIRTAGRRAGITGRGACTGARCAVVLAARGGAPAGLIADGRDMGSKVFPDALLKIYLDASPEERANRRYKQLKDKGMDANLLDLVQELRERDALDSSREHSPLSVPEGAVVIDSTSLSIADVLAQVIGEARRVLPAPNAGS
jgi:cytidylate kinase